MTYTSHSLHSNDVDSFQRGLLVRTSSVSAGKLQQERGQESVSPTRGHVTAEGHVPYYHGILFIISIPLEIQSDSLSEFPAGFAAF